MIIDLIFSHKTNYSNITKLISCSYEDDNLKRLTTKWETKEYNFGVTNWMWEQGDSKMTKETKISN